MEKTVEALTNFPFKSFQEFKKAYFEGIAGPGVDRSFALKWAQNGIHASKFLKSQITFLMTLPYLASLGFIIYTIATKSWLLFLGLPVLIIGFAIFHPGFGKMLGVIRPGFIALIFIGFIWAILRDKHGLIAITLTLIIIWFATVFIYKKAVNALLNAVIRHEDLLCIFWQAKLLNISFSNGNQYWLHFKYEDGKCIPYKD